MDDGNYLLLEKDDAPKELKLVIPSTVLAEISKREHSYITAHTYMHAHMHAHTHMYTRTYVHTPRTHTLILYL